MPIILYLYSAVFLYLKASEADVLCGIASTFYKDTSFDKIWCISLFLVCFYIAFTWSFVTFQQVDFFGYSVVINLDFLKFAKKLANLDSNSI